MSASCRTSSARRRNQPRRSFAELDAEPSITYENSDETKGIVIRQDVNEGTQLKHRQTVAFVVSLGPKEQPTAPEDTPVAIPSFVGLTLEQAQATAKEPRRHRRESGTVYDDNVRKGLRCTPEPGPAAQWSSRARRSRSPSRPARRRRSTPSRAARAAASARAAIRRWPRAAACRLITPKDGYEVATLVIDGTTVLPLTSYSFMNVDSNHTLYVTFREK
ncbi:MAG: hypothetical protein ACLSHG_03980 [Oscillospiraceae bacterium]